MSSPLVDLFAKLGLEIDIKGFETADKYIEKLRTQTATLVEDWNTAQNKMAASSEAAAARMASAAARAKSQVPTPTAPGVPGVPGAPGGRGRKDPGDLRAAFDLVSLDVNAARNRIAARSGTMLEAVSHAVTVARGAIAAVHTGARAARTMAQLIEDTAAAGAKADELSQKLGISAEAVQELGYAASQNGSDTEGLASSLGNLANAAVNAKNGGKEAARAFKDAGLSAKDVVSGKVPLDTALLKVADQFAAMPDGAKKSALAMDLFGKSGKDLIPLLNQGSAGITAMRREAHETGAVIDKKTTKALEAFGDETGKAKTQLAGVRNEAVKAVLPALLEMVKGMQAWIKANRADLVKALVGAMKALLHVAEIIGPVMAGLVKVTAFLADHADLARAIFYAFATGIGTLLLPLFYVLTKIIKNAGGAFDAMGRAARATGSAIRSAFGSIGSFVAGVAETIRAAFEGVFAWIEEKLDYLIDKAKKVRDRGPLALLEDATGVEIDSTVRTIAKNTPVVGAAFGGSAFGVAGNAVHAGVDAYRARGPSAGASNVTIGNTTLHVTSTKADPKEVAQEVGSHMEQFWKNKLRIAKAGI